MSRTKYDDLETHLRDLFERQADSMPVGTRAWDDQVATVSTIVERRRSRAALAAVVATAAAVALVVGIVAIAPGNDVSVGGQPGAGGAVQFHTPQVSLTADDLTIEAGGRTYAPADKTVDVHSDPGTKRYQTIELIWNEQGVEMRLFMYFTSDGHDWWSNEIRTYNGRAEGDWISYTGTFFRTPLGQAFTGNVDLAGTEGSGHLHLANARLEPFLTPAVCDHPTAKYAISRTYDHADIAQGVSGFAFSTMPLLDTATCTPVDDPHDFSYEWEITNPAVALIQASAGPRASWGSPPDTVTTDAGRARVRLDPTQAVNLYKVGPGTATLHLTARRRSTGKVVATIDFPVAVK
jgi:hypothetical protein